MYWMTHPEHGVMPVPEKSETERIAKLGWTVLNEGEKPVFPQTEEKRKPGRPAKAKQ